MGKQHITYFKIENFKKFDTLEVKNIGQFNLIVGDNNVGKTCLLEALLFDERPKNTINWYYELLVKRRLVSDRLHLLKETDSETIFSENTFSFYQKNKKEKITFNINENKYSINNILEEIYTTQNSKYKDFVKNTGLFDYEGIKKKSKNWIVFEENEKIRYLLDLTSTYYENFINTPKNSKIPVIPAVMLNDEIEKYLWRHYERIFIEQNFSSKISKLISEVFNINIVEFQQYNKNSNLKYPRLYIKTKERDYFHNVREYGEGFIRALFSILLILNNDSKKIIIDEIDTGIHYSKMEGFLSAIMKLCQELDVQLFATTHSEECIKVFHKVAKLLGQEERIRLINLQEGNRKMYCTSYSFENIEAGLYSNIEMRS